MATSADRLLLEASLKNLVHHIEARNYKGYDPYDALKSPLFRLPLLKQNKQIRFSAQQLVKRFPFNLRPLLAIPEGYNPVTLGLCLQGLVNLAGNGREADRIMKDIPLKIEFLREELVKMIPRGFHGACWGYDFDWEARYTRIPSYQPNIVSTSIIVNALFSAFNLTGDPSFSEMVRSASQFVLLDLNRTVESGMFIFSYSPFDREQVYNASMKAVRLLAQAYKLTGNELFRKEAACAAEFVVAGQKNDGSWGYSLRQTGGWIDNYHTGYVLDCLDDYCRLCSDERFTENIARGYRFYKDHFIGNDGMPRFYSERSWPADCTAGAQTILTLNRFGDIPKALEVAKWMIRNMQNGDGGFYFRKYRYYKIKTNFIRWSDAWMFNAFSDLCLNLK
jgi:hypothetical protein